MQCAGTLVTRCNKQACSFSCKLTVHDFEDCLVITGQTMLI